jgi:hypothetical protein
MEFKVILYIVIGVGYFIYNIYKKVNAPQKKSKSVEYEQEEYHPEPANTGGGYKTIDDIINDLNAKGNASSKITGSNERVINEGVDNPERTLREIREEKEEIERIQKVEEQRQREMSASFIASEARKAKRAKTQKKVKFDLRKAVLYRAVLERPKF